MEVFMRWSIRTWSSDASGSSKLAILGSWLSSSPDIVTSVGVTWGGPPCLSMPTPTDSRAVDALGSVSVLEAWAPQNRRWGETSLARDEVLANMGFTRDTAQQDHEQGELLQ
ncbi:hypothetical protein C8R44DRAFT_858403 [Mycena epipterygia]|nr:hypothetical protein C8R44DRAFT_858403 [Mycena epipterygia]